MSEKKPPEKETAPPPENGDTPIDKERGGEHHEKTLENWIAGVGAGMKGVFHKLLDQAPPDLRENIIEKVRSHGPGSAAVAVNAAALKTRSLKAKLALKALGKLLQALDSKDSKDSKK